MQQTSQTTLFKAVGASLHYGQKTILDNVNFDLKEGEVVGVVGANGSGKSSFLKLIAGLIDYDQGDLEYKSKIKIGYVGQDVDLDEKLTAFEILAKAWFESRFNIISDENKQSEKLNEDFGLVADIYEELEPWKNIDLLKHEVLVSKLQKLIDSLNFKTPNSLVADLSGGEKRKLAILISLIKKPDIWILDEPTNHLDIDSIRLLEKLIKQFSGSVILISHDRYFLDQISTRLLEIRDTSLFNHIGNYENYLENKAIRLDIESIQDERKTAYLKRELNWVRAGVKARGTKDKGRLDRFNNLKNQKSILRDENLELLLPEIEPLGNKIVNLENVEIQIAGRLVVKNLNYSFQPHTVLGVVGANGCGKTTFIKHILGEMLPSSGKIVIGQNTYFNYQDQEKQNLNLDNTPFEEIGQGQETTDFGSGKISTRKYLKRLLFSNEQMISRIKNFSGGEKARLLLAKTLKKLGNVLILDEPTNDLDLETIRNLEESLINYQGVVVVVSHDRYFLNRVCTQVLYLEGDGNFILSDGGFDELQDKIIQLNKQSGKLNLVSSDYQNKTKKTNPAQLKKDIAKLELRIQICEQKIKTLENEFASVEFYIKSAKEITEKNQKYENLKQQLDLLIKDWEALLSLV